LCVLLYADDQFIKGRMYKAFFRVPLNWFIL